jgi:MFS family permease
MGFPLAVFKLFLPDEFHLSESMIGALVFPCALGMAVASFPMSKLGERIGRAKAVQIGMLLTVIGMWLIATGAVFPVMRQAWVFAVGGIPIGIGFLLAIPAWMASVSDINPQHRGANLGAVMTAQGVGAIIGAPVGSYLYGHMQPLGIRLGLGADFGRYTPFLGCAACLAAGFALSLKILHDR